MIYGFPASTVTFLRRVAGVVERAPIVVTIAMTIVMTIESECTAASHNNRHDKRRTEGSNRAQRAR